MEQKAMGLSLLSRATVQDVGFQRNTMDFQSHGSKCTEDTVALNHEKLYFLHCSVRGVLYDLINVLGAFSVILQPLNFLKAKFTDNIFLVLVR